LKNIFNITYGGIVFNFFKKKKSFNPYDTKYAMEYVYVCGKTIYETIDILNTIYDTYDTEKLRANDYGFKRVSLQQWYSRNGNVINNEVLDEYKDTLKKVKRYVKSHNMSTEIISYNKAIIHNMLDKLDKVEKDLDACI
jgi:hypothetical protein